MGPTTKQLKAIHDYAKNIYIETGDATAFAAMRLAGELLDERIETGEV